MSQRTPPTPGNNLRLWADQLYAYLSSESRIKGQVEPETILFAHLLSGNKARATVDGLMLYDPAKAAPVFSEGGEFHALARDPGWPDDFVPAFGVQLAPYVINPNVAAQKAFNFSPNGQLHVGVGMYRVVASVGVSGVNRNNFSTTILYDTAVGGFYPNEVLETALELPEVGFRATYSGIMYITTAGLITPACVLSGAQPATIGVNSFFSASTFLSPPTSLTPNWS